MKAVNVDDVLRILDKYGKYIFVTDEKLYFSMVDEIANLEELKQERDLTETETQLKIYRHRCKILEEQVTKQKLDYYAELDKQAVEIALLKAIIEDRGGFHKFHEHVREEDSQG